MDGVGTKRGNLLSLNKLIVGEEENRFTGESRCVLPDIKSIRYVITLTAFTTSAWAAHG